MNKNLLIADSLQRHSTVLGLLDLFSTCLSLEQSYYTEHGIAAYLGRVMLLPKLSFVLWKANQKWRRILEEAC